jgi:hypothetical protein
MLPLPRARNFLLCCGLFCALSGGAVAQSINPLGTEFSLSGALAGDQMLPAVAIDDDGGWLVWRDNRVDNSGTGIAARRVDAALQGAGSVVKVNNSTTGDQDRPAVALLANGGAAVAWQSGLLPGLTDVYARFLKPDGGFASAEIKVSPATSTLQRRYVTNLLAHLNNRLITRRFAISEVTRVSRDLSGHPAVATLPDGSVVVAYDTVRTTRSRGWRLEARTTMIGGRTYLNDVLRPFLQVGSWGHDVFLRRFSATGQPLGSEVQVNQFASNHQRYPSLTVLANGNLVVAWVSEERVNNSTFGLAFESDRVDIVARVFNAQAQPLGDEFTVNTSSYYCGNPSLAPLAGGGFVAVWSENSGARPDSWDVFTRAFQADGSTTQDVVRLNTYTIGDQYQPRVAAAGGEQMAVWTSLGQDGSWEGVYGRLLVDGTPVGDELLVNTATASKQFMPAVSGVSDGQFLGVWSGIARGSAFDIFGQAFVSAPGASAPGMAPALADLNAAESMVRAQSPFGTPRLPALSVPPWLAATSSAGAPLRVGLALNRHARELRWNTSFGRLYQVQISTNLSDWTNLGEPRTAVGASDAVALTGEQTMAFFRVIQVN